MNFFLSLSRYSAEQDLKFNLWVLFQIDIDKSTNDIEAKKMLD